MKTPYPPDCEHRLSDPISNYRRVLSLGFHCGDPSFSAFPVASNVAFDFRHM